MRLRKAVGTTEPPVLLVTRQTVQWNLARATQLDVTTFARLARSTTTADLEAAAAVYTGLFLAGFCVPGCPEFDEWLTLTREQCERLALQVLDALTQSYLAARSYALAEAAARRQLAIAPWRESAHRQLLEALARAGLSHAALADYAASAQMLEADLGIAPDAQTTALYERIRYG